MYFDEFQYSLQPMKGYIANLWVFSSHVFLQWQQQLSNQCILSWDWWGRMDGHSTHICRHIGWFKYQILFCSYKYAVFTLKVSACVSNEYVYVCLFVKWNNRTDMHMLPASLTKERQVQLTNDCNCIPFSLLTSWLIVSQRLPLGTVCRFELAEWVANLLWVREWV